MMRFPERFRATGMPPPFNSTEGEPYGYFVIRGKDARGRPLKVMACSGAMALEGEPQHRYMGWDHVSVSVMRQRPQEPLACPTWEEMCLVRDLFWEPEDRVVQFHPPRSEYVNTHAACLHLWRWTGGEFPHPSPLLV